MATNLNVKSNYVGTVAAEIFGKAWKMNNTLSYLNVMENVTYNQSLRLIDYTSGRRDYSCGFIAGGDIDLTEKYLTPKKFTNDFEICLEDLRATWSDSKMGVSAENASPIDFENALINEVLMSEAEALGYNIWQGVGTNSGEFDGYLTILSSPGSGVIVATGPAIVESNVEAELKKALALVPVALRSKPLNVFVAPDVFQAYTFYLISKGITATGEANDKVAKFGKYNLIEDAGMNEGDIVIAEQRNLVAGYGTMDDMSKIYVDSTSAERKLDGMIKGKMVYNFGVNIIRPNEVVYRKTV